VGASVSPAVARQKPGSPRLASAEDRNWTQECVNRNVDKDCKWDKEQGPFHKLAMDKECKTQL